MLLREHGTPNGAPGTAYSYTQRLKTRWLHPTQQNTKPIAGFYMAIAWVPWETTARKRCLLQRSFEARLVLLIFALVSSYLCLCVYTAFLAPEMACAYDSIIPAFLQLFLKFRLLLL